MAAKVKQQTASCAQAVTEQDLVAMEEEFNLSNAKESIFEQLNVTHSIHYQQYNCSMVENNTKKSQTRSLKTPLREFQSCITTWG